MAFNEKVDFEQIVSDIQKLVRARKPLEDIHAKENEELKQHVASWVKTYNQYAEVGVSADGNPIYADIKKTLNKLIEPIKEALKIIEAYETEAVVKLNQSQLSIFDL